jgi:hypothetical protein
MTWGHTSDYSDVQHQASNKILGLILIKIESLP